MKPSQCVNLQHAESGEGHSGMFGDVGGMSAYPSIATEMVRR